MVSVMICSITPELFWWLLEGSLVLKFYQNLNSLQVKVHITFIHFMQKTTNTYIWSTCVCIVACQVNLCCFIVFVVLVITNPLDLLWPDLFSPATDQLCCNNQPCEVQWEQMPDSLTGMGLYVYIYKLIYVQTEECEASGWPHKKASGVLSWWQVE